VTFAERRVGHLLEPDAGGVVVGMHTPPARRQWCGVHSQLTAGGACRNRIDDRHGLAVALGPESRFRFIGPPPGLAAANTAPSPTTHEATGSSWRRDGLAVVWSAPARHRGRDMQRGRTTTRPLATRPLGGEPSGRRRRRAGASPARQGGACLGDAQSPRRFDGWDASGGGRAGIVGSFTMASPFPRSRKKRRAASGVSPSGRPSRTGVLPTAPQPTSRRPGERPSQPGIPGPTEPSPAALDPRSPHVPRPQSGSPVGT
jgi:hypothetical protein